ncbi:MAG: ParA family protein, partial [Gammaproteobacteria bacterium]|nr:ParA family protein [Gammaproteobacteria bacterium]
LVAAHKCLIPFDCDAFSRESLYTLLQTVDEVKEDHNGSLEMEGVIVNQYQNRANLPQQLVEELIAEGHPVLDSRLSPSVKVRESHSASKPLIYFAPNHKLTEEYRALHQEINA